MAVKSTAVTVGTTPTALPTTPLKGRIRVLVGNGGSVAVFVGDASVTTSTGVPVAAGATVPFEFGYAERTDDNVLYGVVATGTQDVEVLEIA